MNLMIKNLVKSVLPSAFLVRFLLIIAKLVRKILNTDMMHHPVYAKMDLSKMKGLAKKYVETGKLCLRNMNVMMEIILIGMGALRNAGLNLGGNVQGSLVFVNKFWTGRLNPLLCRLTVKEIQFSLEFCLIKILIWKFWMENPLIYMRIFNLIWKKKITN